MSDNQQTRLIWQLATLVLVMFFIIIGLVAVVIGMWGGKC